MKTHKKICAFSASLMVVGPKSLEVYEYSAGLKSIKVGRPVIMMAVPMARNEGNKTGGRACPQ